MKILIDAYNLVTQYESGGIQVRVKNFYKEMSKKNIEIKLFDKWNDKIENFDILHIFKITPENYATIRYAKSKNVKVVVSSVLQKKSRNKTRICNALSKTHIYTADYFIKRGLILADAVIAQTEEEKAFLRKNYKINAEKIHIIPNPVDIAILNGEKKLIIEKYNIPSDYILQVGRIDNNKNQLNVIRAVKDTNIPLVIIGGPNINQKQYFEKCKKEATQNVYILGWINHEDPLLASAFANAKVLVLPSFKETFGNVLIEGGISGANLIVSNTIPISKEKIFNEVIKVNPNNIKEIKKAIQKAYNLPKNEELKKRLLQEFSINNIIDKHMNIFNKLVEEGYHKK